MIINWEKLNRYTEQLMEECTFGQIDLSFVQHDGDTVKIFTTIKGSFHDMAEVPNVATK